MRRRQQVVKAVAIGVIVSFLATVVGLVALSAGGGDDPGRQDLSEDAEELVALLDKRDEATYHAKYEATAPGTERLTLETWQSPPSVRQDSEIRAGTQLVRSRVLVTDGSRIRCTQRNNAAWQCRPAAAGEGETDPLAAFRARLGQGTVKASDASVDGREARCFVLETPEGRSELCAVPETGIPVRVTGGDTQLRLVTLDDAVDPELFQPPAPVGSSS